jgi:hypothetical protein
MQLRLQHALLWLGTVVGAGGCVTGGADQEPVSGGNAGDTNGSGSTSSAGGSSSSSGSTTGNAPGSGSTTSNGGNAPTGGSPSNTAGTGSGSGPSTGGNAPTGGSNGASTDCKRGIAYPQDSLDNPDVNAKLTWWYRWHDSAKTVGAGIEFVPMIAGGGSNPNDVTKVIRADAKYLLGYNEPNFFEQANLSAAQAAADWPKVEAVAKAKNLKIVSPAVNFCGDDGNKTGPCHDTNPWEYLQDFFAACANCQVDYVAVHWYNCSGDELNWYLDQFKQFNRPIWLTEFACAYGPDTSVAGNEKYMREAIPILEGRADVFRYSWFSATPIPNARLLKDDGSLTALGKVYLDLPHGSACTP